MKKVLGYVGDFLLVLVVIIAIAITFISLKSDDRGISNIGGYMPFNIQTASMEPTIKTGDLIITQEADFDSLEVGDIISFLSKEQDTVIIKTHRITSVNNENGIKSYVTKGDNNDAEDDTAVVEADFVGKYNGKRIGHLGSILSFLQSRVGFFIFIIIPLFALFIYQLYKFIVTIIEEKKKDLVASIKAEQTEKEKKSE